MRAEPQDHRELHSRAQSEAGPISQVRREAVFHFKRTLQTLNVCLLLALRWLWPGEPTGLWAGMCNSLFSVKPLECALLQQDGEFGLVFFVSFFFPSNTQLPVHRVSSRNAAFLYFSL